MNIDNAIRSYQRVMHGETDGVPNVNEGHLSEKVRLTLEKENVFAAAGTYIRHCAQLIETYPTKSSNSISKNIRTGIIAALGFGEATYTVIKNESYIPIFAKNVILTQALIGLGMFASDTPKFWGDGDGRGNGYDPHENRD